MPNSTSTPLPVTLHPGEKPSFLNNTGRQNCASLPHHRIDADADTATIDPFGVKYLARVGRQSHFTIADTRGLRHAVVTASAAQPSPSRLLQAIGFTLRKPCRRFIYLQRRISQQRLADVRPLILPESEDSASIVLTEPRGMMTITALVGHHHSNICRARQ